MRGSLKKLRKVYAQNITVEIEKAFQFLVCVDLREFHRKLISFLAFYLRQLAKYNMDTYIQINIILKGQEYIGVFFFKKIYFSFTRKYIPAEGKIHVYFNTQRFNAQIRKNKIYKRDSELFSLTRGWGAGTVPLLRESSTPPPLLICA